MLRFPRKQVLNHLPHWLRTRIDLHHTRINELIARASQATQPTDRVLDAGAGEGQYRPQFAHARYVGLDLAVGDTSWNYSVLDVIGNLEHLPVPDRTFDTVLCFEVLEHLREPYQVLKEIQRVLSPTGHLYFSVPMSWHQHQKPHDYFRYTSYGLKYLLEKSGFEVVELRPTGGFFWFLSIQFQMMSMWVFPNSPSTTVHVLLLPIKLVFQMVFFIGLPLLCYYLDGLDKYKDQTMAWTGIAVPRGQ